MMFYVNIVCKCRAEYIDFTFRSTAGLVDNEVFKLLFQYFAERALPIEKNIYDIRL